LAFGGGYSYELNFFPLDYVLCFHFVSFKLGLEVFFLIHLY